MLPKVKKVKKNIYLDHAATTYLLPEVERAMQPFWREKFGNPSSLYAQGREAKKAIDSARAQIAAILNCRPDEIVFTAGGTESINTAIIGLVVEHLLSAKNPKKPHIITTTIEHHAVLESFAAMKMGAEVTYVRVDGQGFVDPADVLKAVRPNTILVSVMYANNEIGTVEPIAQIGAQLHKLNLERAKKKLPEIFFHSDACQAAGALDLNVQKLNVDLLSLNASKIYGPKQVGLLYVRKGVKIYPIIHGGGQEKSLRSGTENVPGIVGFAKALEISQKNRLKENKRLRLLRNYLIAQILKKVPQAYLNGPSIGSDSEKNVLRLPNNVNFSFPGVEGEALMLYLDSYGIACSTGSACSSTSLDPSHVILKIGRPYEYAHGSMRFSLGRSNSKKDLDYLMQILPDLVAALRKVEQLDTKALK